MLFNTAYREVADRPVLAMVIDPVEVWYYKKLLEISERIRVPFATQAYFAKILTDNREMWETSDDVRKFFSPGPPTSYSAALARRRREQIKVKPCLPCVPLSCAHGGTVAMHADRLVAPLEQINDLGNDHRVCMYVCIVRRNKKRRRWFLLVRS